MDRLFTNAARQWAGQSNRKGRTHLVNMVFAGIITVLFVVMWNALGAFAPLVFLSENQALYIFSSAAQVIAAVYGLTIAGYTFLRNQQDRLSDRDETLIEIFDTIQSEQFTFVSFVTVSSLASIIMSLLAIAYRESVRLWVGLATLNSASALFITSLLWTGFFVLDAMRPGKITRASQSIKKEVEAIAAPGSNRSGKLEDFLRDFNAIEKMLEEFALNHLEKPRQSTVEDPYQQRNTRPSWTKPRIVRAMVSQKIIPWELGEELLALIRYRNALVHGQDMTVSEEMAKRVKNAREELEALTQRRENEDNNTDE